MAPMTFADKLMQQKLEQFDSGSRPATPTTAVTTPQSVLSGSTTGSRYGSQDNLTLLDASDADSPMTRARTDLGPARRKSTPCLREGLLFPEMNNLDGLSPAHHSRSMKRQNSLPQVRTPASRLLSRRRSTSNALTVQVDSSPSPVNLRRRHSSQGFASRRPSAIFSEADLETGPRQEVKLLPQGQKIFDLFSWDEVLQEEGDGGKVVVCQPKGESSLPRKRYVMKMRSKASLRWDNMEDQFRKAQERLLNLPPHVGVLPLVEVLEDECYYYVVMECATGGSFLPSLLAEFKDGVMPEQAVKQVIREVLEAVGHVHEQGMLHRDIKPDNLVMQVQENEYGQQCRKVALIDFDHAEPEYDPNTPARGGFCGTVIFSAPEAIHGGFSEASDLYSVGVILYMLMTGKLPYPEEVFQSYYENIQLKQRLPRDPWQERRRNWRGAVLQRMKETEVDWSCNPWPELPGCKAFCQSLLAFNALERPVSAEAALESDWLAQPDFGC